MEIKHETKVSMSGKEFLGLIRTHLENQGLISETNKITYIDLDVDDWELRITIEK